MSVLVSVLTPEWLVHVSDAPGAPRTALWRAGTRRGLFTWVGDGDPGWLADIAAERADGDPEAIATHIGVRAAVAFPTTRACAWMGGFGFSPEGHEAGFRWEASSLEEPGTFAVEGAWVVPTPVRAGRGAERARGRAQSSFAIHVPTDRDELPTAFRRGIEDLPRVVRDGASAVALACAKLVRDATGADALVVHLPRVGAVEAAILGEKVRVLAAQGDAGIARLA